jgi:hypothetical protein
MASIKDDIVDFVREAQYRIAELNEVVTDFEEEGKRNGKKYRQSLQDMHELSMISDAILISNMEIYDADGNEVVNFTERTDSQLRQYMSDIRVRYELRPSPYADLPFVITPYVYGTSSGISSTIPSGGFPDWYLTYNTLGDLIWKQLPSVIDGGTL